MIRARNLGELIIDLSVPGAQAVNANAKTFVVPFACQLKAVYAKLGTAGTTGTQTTDLMKNGTSFVSAGHLLSFATGVQACTYGNGNLTADPLTFAKGDIIEVNTSAIHTTPAKDLAILIVLERARAAGKSAKCQVDTIGSDSDEI